MEEKKYELVKNDCITIKYAFVTDYLYRIKALKDFGDVKAGDIGGYIEKEDNLSHEGNCWVYNDAIIRGSAKLFDNAKVYGNAKVSGWVKVSDNAEVFGNAEVYGDAKISGCAKVYDNAKVSDESTVSDNAKVHGNAKVFGHSTINKTREVFGYNIVYHNTEYTPVSI